MSSTFPRTQVTPGFRAKAVFVRAPIENNRREASNFVFEARHLTCQSGCVAQNAGPESVLPKAVSCHGHQQGLPLAVSRLRRLAATFAKGAAGSYRRAMVLLNPRTQEKRPGSVTVALSFRAFPAHVEPCGRKGITQIQRVIAQSHRVGVCRNRKSRSAFSRHALSRAWSFP